MQAITSSFLFVQPAKNVKSKICKRENKTKQNKKRRNERKKKGKN